MSKARHSSAVKCSPKRSPTIRHIPTNMGRKAQFQRGVTWHFTRSACSVKIRLASNVDSRFSRSLCFSRLQTLFDHMDTAVAGAGGGGGDNGGGGGERTGGCGGRGGKKFLSQSKRAGLVFPVGRIGRLLKKLRCGDRVSRKASVSMTGVLEYMASQLVGLAGDVAKTNKRKRIKPRHILLGARSDPEFGQLLKDVHISGGGVVPNINPSLLGRRRGRRGGRGRGRGGGGEVVGADDVFGQGDADDDGEQEEDGEGEFSNAVIGGDAGEGGVEVVVADDVFGQGDAHDDDDGGGYVGGFDFGYSDSEQEEDGEGEFSNAVIGGDAGEEGGVEVVGADDVFGQGDAHDDDDGGYVGGFDFGYGGIDRDFELEDDGEGEVGNAVIGHECGGAGEGRGGGVVGADDVYGQGGHVQVLDFGYGDIDRDIELEDDGEGEVGNAVIGHECRDAGEGRGGGVRDELTSSQTYKLKTMLEMERISKEIEDKQRELATVVNKLNNFQYFVVSSVEQLQLACEKLSVKKVFIPPCFEEPELILKAKKMSFVLVEDGGNEVEEGDGGDEVEEGGGRGTAGSSSKGKSTK